jgi:hypothetical protein
LINIEEDLDEKNKSMTNKLEQAYILDWDNSHLLDLDYDFDWEKSLYQPHPRMNNRVTSISKLVLTEPKNDLPPIFRLSAYSTALFVSAEARKLLEKEGIKGIKFQDINTYQC